MASKPEVQKPINACADRHSCKRMNHNVISRAVLNSCPGSRTKLLHSRHIGFNVHAQGDMLIR
jgi:hypothetical protein